MVCTGNVKAALLEHPGERCHRGAANPNQMDMLLLHECDTRTDAGSACTAASKFSTTFCLTLSVAPTPRGSVKLLLETWPDLSPNAIGTPSPPRMRTTRDRKSTRLNSS